ncbi:MAG TPA: histidinol-phosphatase HisJ family protein [Clostridia bacterium]|nr:histidinol-phosphatase HisJ family protein [Clostridia bacterium]
MRYTDHHVHTKYSPDSDASIGAYLIRAKELKLEKVIFTDHIDMGAIESQFQKHIDYHEYFKSMKKLEKEYEIPIKIGVEIGYERNYKEKIDDFLNKYPFDFVIAALHYGDGKDFYLGDFFKGKSQHQAYLRYFELVLEMVENFNNFDVLGHLDHIVKYGPFKDKTYDYTKYKKIIDDILWALIKKGKGIELNTSGLRSKLKTTFPKEGVLKRYQELGGQVITIGSDAHFNRDYYAGILQGMELLKSLGFSQISSFSHRRVKQLDISKGLDLK